MIRKILVGTDGSRGSEGALFYAADLVKQVNGELILLGVVDKSYISLTMPPPGSPAGMRVPTEEAVREATEAYLDDAAAICEQRGVFARQVMRSGDPVEEIIQEAQQSQVDMIVVGSHGRSAIKAAVVGSVAFGVIHKSREVPVLVVRRDDRGE